MKAKRWLALVVAALLMNGALSVVDSPRWTLMGGAIAKDAPQQVDIGFFYEELAPYGDWRPYESYDWVWYPDVDNDWRPYTAGYWAFTDDYGWVWVSSEPWGWIVFHYGRWFFDEDYGGWAWVPDTEWGPAWVSWRSGDGFVGWAPLPPRARFRPGVGFSSSDLDYGVSSYAWSFVPMPLFLSARIEQVIVPPPRNVTIIHNTVNITHYTVINQRVINRGIDIHRLERETRTPVIRYRALDVDRPMVGRHSIQDGVVPVFRPRVVGKAHGPPPSGPTPRRATRPGIYPPDAVPGRIPREPRAGFPDRDPGDFVAPRRGDRYTPERNHPVDVQPPVDSPRRPRPPRDEAEQIQPQPPVDSPHRPRPHRDEVERTQPQPPVDIPHRPRPHRDEVERTQPPPVNIPHRPRPPTNEVERTQPQPPADSARRSRPPRDEVEQPPATVILQRPGPAKEGERPRPKSQEVMEQIRQRYQQPVE